MKQSRLHMFFIWLMIVALIFGGVPLHRMYADDTTTAPKDVSDRLVFEERFDAHERTSKKGAEEFLPIYVEGIQDSAHSGEVTKGTAIKLKYKWSIPEDNFRGTAAGIAHQDRVIHPGDTFRIELPSSGEYYELLKFRGFAEQKQIVNGKDYGTWNIETDATQKKQYISGVFGQGIADGDVAEVISGMQNGFFEIMADASGTGTAKLNIKGDDVKKLYIIKNMNFYKWGPGWFYKQGGYDPSNYTVNWSLITGFDKLRFAFEKGVNFYPETPVNADSNWKYSPSTDVPKKTMIIEDRLPKGTKIQTLSLKIPLYITTPKAEKNMLNYDGSGNLLPENDKNFVKAGQLSYSNQLHEMRKKYENKDTTLKSFEHDDVEHKINGSDTLDHFKQRVNLAATTSGMPKIGVYEDEDAIIVYANLGASPNTVMDYKTFFSNYKATWIKETDLEAFLNTKLADGEIDQDQWRAAKEVYLGGTHEGKILAWSLEILTKVNDMDYAYINDGRAYLTDESGTTTPGSDKSLVQYFRLDSGVEIVRKLSFPVIKKWVDSGGNPITPDRDSVQIDVYDKQGKKIDGASILLTKANHWRGTVTGLPIMYDQEGNRIEDYYTLREETVEGYTSKVSQEKNWNIGYGFTITNTKKNVTNPKTITVNKVWAPGSTEKPVTIYLEKKKSNGEWEKVGRVELKNPWSHVFGNLDPSAEYRVTEEELPGYKTHIPTEVADTGDTNNTIWTITNTQQSDSLIDIEVEKVWEGGNVLGSIIIELYAKTESMTEKPVKRVILDQSQFSDPTKPWTYTFSKVPATIDGKAVTYRVAEVPVDGYDARVEPEEATVDTTVTNPPNLKFTVTNTAKKIEKGSIKVTKKWIGEIAKEVVVELYSVLNGKESLVKTVIHEKDPKKGREEDKPKTVTLNEGNSWTGSFDGINLQSPEGRQYGFTVRERAIAGYTPVVTVDDDKGSAAFAFIITNTQNAVKKNIPVVKKWLDTSGNPLTVTDGEVKAVLYRINDDNSETEIKEIALNQGNQWKGEFKDVTIQEEGGKKLKFVVKEKDVPEGYESTVTPIGVSIENGFIITNTKTAPPVTSPSKEETEDETEEEAEEETTKATSTTEKVTEKTSASAPQSSTESTTASSVETTDATTEETTERSTETAASTTISTSETVTTSSSPVAVVTTAPTAPPTTRTFEFIEIFEDVPLGIKTTAPLDLELVLIEEAIPLSGLPYTYSIPAEILVGIGMLILTIGLTIGRRL